MKLINDVDSKTLTSDQWQGDISLALYAPATISKVRLS